MQNEKINGHSEGVCGRPPTAAGDGFSLEPKRFESRRRHFKNGLPHLYRRPLVSKGLPHNPRRPFFLCSVFVEGGFQMKWCDGIPMFPNFFLCPLVFLKMHNFCSQWVFFEKEQIHPKFFCSVVNGTLSGLYIEGVGQSGSKIKPLGHLCIIPGGGELYDTFL